MDTQDGQTNVTILGIEAIIQSLEGV